MKHKLIYILILIFAFQTNLQAQKRQGKQHSEMMKKRKKEFIKQNLQLTEKEEKALMPVYEAFEEAMHSLHRERMMLIKSFDKNSLNISDAEIKKMNEKIISLHQQEAGLHKEYHHKFESILPPVKVFLLYKTEHDFKRILIKEFKHRGGQGNNKKQN